MEKRTKRWLAAAASLVLLGLTMVIAVMATYQWDFSKLSTEQYETRTFEIGEEFDSISIRTTVADITFAVSEDGGCKVVCDESKKTGYSVAVQGGTLTISEVDQRNWYDHIGIFMSTPAVTVYLPDAAYDTLTIRERTGDVEIPKDFRFESMDVLTTTGDVRNHASAAGIMSIETNTGDIHVENVFADTLALSASTGSIRVSGVDCKGDVRITVSTGKTGITDTRCENLMSVGSTGKISLKNVIASETFSIETSTGHVRLDGCDAADIFIGTDTGDVTGTLLSEKVFLAETGTGSLDVPQSITGGRCRITTDTGDIKLAIQ